jgi:uncharacterized protein (TIGR02996 family)
MDEDLSFLRGVLNHPGDDTLRLVYADWLEEHNDPRAEFLRLQVERQRSSGPQTAWEKRIRDLAPQLDSRWLGLMVQSRALHPGARLDLVTITDGKGLIEVRGLGEAVLLIEGKPVALNWDDGQGSIAQYLVFTGHTRGADYARQLREFVESGPDGNRHLVEQIEPLLAVFAPGTYRIEYTPASAGWVQTLECPDPAAGPSHELMGYYPDDYHNLICTQANTSLDAGRVGFFRARIRAGAQPVVLTASASSACCEFVIDGHHKLAAYGQEGMKPAFLGIVREGAPEISLNEGLGWLPPGHPGIPEYRRMKGYA